MYEVKLEAADEAAAASEAALAPRIYQLELLELAKQRNVGAGRWEPGQVE